MGAGGEWGQKGHSPGGLSPPLGRKPGADLISAAEAVGESETSFVFQNLESALPG